MLYKYMPIRKVFFENFFVRATQRSVLNDPFEVLPSKGWLEAAYAYHNKKPYKGTFEELLKQTTRENLNHWGIISLTCRPDNPLMWSHYANEHKGMVIGIDEQNSALKTRFGCNEDTDLTQSVIYRKDRIDNFDKDKIFSPYLYKSLEWAYEEEQRILVGNMFKCDCWFYLFERDQEALLAHQNNEIAELKLLSSSKTGHVVSFLTSDIKYPEPAFYIDDARFMAMFKIPPEAIKSVTFGVNAEANVVNEISVYIRNKPELKHVVIRRAKLDESTFDLYFVAEK